MDEIYMTMNDLYRQKKKMGMPGPEYSTPKHITKHACSGLVAIYESLNLRNDRYPICRLDIPSMILWY
jgi:hypothetical protein